MRTFTYKLDYKDFLDFNSSYLASKLKSPLFIGVALVLVALTAYLCVADLPGIVAGSKSLSDSPLVYVLLVVVVYPAIVPFTMRVNARKVFRTNKLLSEEQTLLIAEDRIESRNPSGTIALTGDKLHGIAYGRKGIYFYASANQAIILPARVLGAERAEAECFLKEHFPGKR